MLLNPTVEKALAPQASVKLREAVEETIRNVAATATADDRALVEEIIAMAKAGNRVSKIFTLSPAGVCSTPSRPTGEGRW